MPDYYQLIVNRLRGDTADLEQVPKDRLDWHGVASVLRLYHKTTGEDREAFIRAMGQVLEEGEQPAEIMAQLLQMVSSLDLAQLEPSIRRLELKPFASREPLYEAIANYFAFRNVQHHQLPAT